MQAADIFCIGPTPALQRVMVFGRLQVDQVNRAVITLDGIAGKAVNVAKVLKALGEQPVVFGFAGGLSGKSLTEALKSRGISTRFVSVEPSTRQCITVVAQDAGTQTELVEESKAVPAAAYDELLRSIRECNSMPGAVVCSGTLTPGAPAAFYKECIKFARTANAVSVVDAQGPVLLEAITAAPDLVKPNRAEIAKTLNRQFTSEAELTTAARDLLDRGSRNVVVTAGPGTTLAFTAEGAWRITPPRIQAVNPIGSGDAFTAALTSRFIKGDDLGEACRWGAAAGAANALTLMAGELDAAEVTRLARLVQVEKISR